MKGSETSKEDFKTLLNISTTTFAIFVSLGFAIPLIVSKGTDVSVNLFTNALWLIGMILNGAVVLGILVLYSTGEINKSPKEKWLKLCFLVLLISYIFMMISLVFYSNVVSKV